MAPDRLPPDRAEPATAPAAASAREPSPNAAASPAVVPSLALGPDLEPAAFSPGRYASVIQRSARGTHALQRLSEDSTASFVLELAADGSATACRGWRYLFENDGPTVHSEERFREQQGYRGRHEERDGFVVVDLRTDDSACAPVREYAQAAPRRAPALRLRCILAVPRNHGLLPAPALLCRWLRDEVIWPEESAYVVPGLTVSAGEPGGWMALGAGHGLRISITGKPPGARTGAPTSVRMELAAEPVLPDAWTHRF